MAKTSPAFALLIIFVHASTKASGEELVVDHAPRSQATGDATQYGKRRLLTKQHPHPVSESLMASSMESVANMWENDESDRSVASFLMSFGAPNSTADIPALNSATSSAPPASPASSAWGNRTVGPYSDHVWRFKNHLVSKLPPASFCGSDCEVQFRSKFFVPYQRKCVKGYMDVPLYGVLLINPSQAAQPAVQAFKNSFAAEWTALFDGASTATHGAEAFHKPWAKTLNGPNDVLVYSKAKLTLQDSADRLLKSTAARLGLLIQDAENDLPRLSVEWIYNAASLFHEHPHLGLVGMAPSSASMKNGFGFTAEAGAGPWLVRRDAMIEAGAVGQLNFCVDSCPLSEGLGALTWQGGFQVGMLHEDAKSWPVPSVPMPKESLSACSRLHGQQVDSNVVLEAVSAAQEALNKGEPTSAFLAVKKQCTPAKPIEKTVRDVPAQCGSNDGSTISTSILVQYFSRAKVIKPLLAALKAVPEQNEILINNDSRSEHDSWLNMLPPRGFLFHCPNVHEIRGYNRLSRFSRGDMVIMMQDDDQPTSGTWVKNARQLFNAHRRLGMIGGLRGRMDVGKNKDKETNQNAGKKYGPRFLKIKHVDKATHIRFMYMYKVNAAPLLARREPLMQLGGLQEAFSCPGDAGIGFDFEYSIRLWRTGYQVGLYDVAFKRPQPGKRGKAGTRSNDKKWNIRRHNENLNNGLLYKIYPGFHHAKGTKLAMNALQFSQ